MGSLYSAKCPQCDYQIDEVTYGVSYGMGVSMITSKCLSCKELFNLSNHSNEDYENSTVLKGSFSSTNKVYNFLEKKDINGDFVISLTQNAKCDKCKSSEVGPWNHECPKCNSRMTKWMETILWD